LPLHQKVGGLSLAAAAGKRKERGEKERYEKGILCINLTKTVFFLSFFENLHKNNLQQ
jgi:hypothetical protein